MDWTEAEARLDTLARETAQREWRARIGADAARDASPARVELGVVATACDPRRWHDWWRGLWARTAPSFGRLLWCTPRSLVGHDATACG